MRLVRAMNGWFRRTATPFLAVLLLGVNDCRGADHEVGTAVCIQCHDGFIAPDQTQFLQSKHFLNEVECETCHGPGFLHVRAGGRGGAFIENFQHLDFSQRHALCAQCHETAVDGFIQSGHATKEVATCIDCHDVHREPALTAPKETNAICLQCHQAIDFPDDDVTDLHTGPFHPVDPAGTGASRCFSCHMPPLEQRAPRGGPLDHTLFTRPPNFTLAAAEAGITPLPPNSCAGVTACHDPDYPDAGPPRDVNDLALMRRLQPFYDLMGQTARDR